MNQDVAEYYVSLAEAETTGGNADTWTNYSNTGGYEGPPFHQTLERGSLAKSQASW
ncbi:MAG TPA: hypothetical protein VEH81_09715 [Ktedonobacteraceae bacterium]|nr:hypothetical protein [Ktedonobacteraceae bacterium]